jgi:hypothetical protein
MQANEIPIVDVLCLRALDGCRPWLRFTDGSEGVRDLSDLIASGGPMVEPLKDPNYFARVRGNGRSDLAEWFRSRSDQSVHGVARFRRVESSRCGVMCARFPQHRILRD